jgi:hypothetical protein
MPELPDVTVYCEALASRVVGQRLERVKLASPFVLRSYDPPLDATFGRDRHSIRRIGSARADPRCALHRDPPHDRRSPALARAGA